MKYIIRLTLLLTCFFMVSSAQAAWVSLTSNVEQVVTLGDRFMIYFADQPQTTCPYRDAFGISPEGTLSAEARRNILAIVLIAQTTGRTITVWYDDTNCDPALQRPTTGQFNLVSN